MLHSFIKSPVTYFLIAVNFLVMGMILNHSNGTPNAQVLSGMGGMNGGNYSTAVFTYMFLHGSILHIVMNMLGLFIFGRRLEPVLGSFKFFMFYLLAGLVGGMFIAMFSNPLVITVGASGAVIGLIGAELALHLKYKTFKTKAGASDVKSISFDLVLIALVSLLPMVSWEGHLGGFLGGFLGVYLYYSLVVDKPKLDHRYISD